MRVTWERLSGSLAIVIHRESNDEWCMDEVQTFDNGQGPVGSRGWAVEWIETAETNVVYKNVSYDLDAETVTIDMSSTGARAIELISLALRDNSTSPSTYGMYLIWSSNNRPECPTGNFTSITLPNPNTRLFHDDIDCPELSTDSSWSSLATLRRPSVRPTASISINRDTAYAGQSYTVTWTASGDPPPTVRVRFRTGSGDWSTASTEASAVVPLTVLASWPLGTQTWEIRATNSAGSTTQTDAIDIIASPVEPATDSDWSALQRMDPFAEPATDSDWSSLARLTREANRPPVWNLPAAFNVTIDNSVTFDLLDYCSDPDGDSLSFTVSESSDYFSISLSGSMLIVTGGDTDRRPAGNIALTASDGQASAPASVPVNVLDLSRNTAPVVATPTAPFPSVILTGQGINRVQAGDNFVATDEDGDSIRTWDASPPNGWREESTGYLSSSTTPNAQQTGFVQLSAVEDYFSRFTIMASQTDPQYMTWDASYRVRCRDSRRAWSDYVPARVEVIQAVHGSRHDLDSFQQRPDYRQPNIWAFKKGATTGASAGGVHYQYATPDEARADKANWAGSISYAAYRLYVLRDGNEPSRPHITAIRNVHASLDAVLADDNVTFTPKPNAAIQDRGEYTSSHDWEQLCQVFVVSGGDTTSPAYWASVNGFIFIDGGDPPTADTDINGSDGPVTAEPGDSVIWNVRAANFSTVEIRIDTPTGAGPWTVVVSPSDPYSEDQSLSALVSGVTETTIFVFHVRATNSAGVVASDSVQLTIVLLEPSTDSDWSSLTRMAPEPSTDSDWSSLTRMAPVAPSTDSEWSELTRMAPEPSTDSEWSTLEEMAPPAPSTDSAWSSLERMTPLADTEDGEWSLLVRTAESATDSEWSELVELSEPATDSDWSSLVQLLSVDVNHPPVCAPLPLVDMEPNTNQIIDITRYLSDVDGDDITISFTPPVVELPIVSISAGSNLLRPDQSTNIMWSATGEYLTITDPFGGSQASGIRAVTRDSLGSETYTITATNAAGSATLSVTVVWTVAPPSVSVSASDTSPTVGESVTVSWNITGEDITYSDFIGISSGAFGALSGSSTFRRTTPGSHTYTATATNAGGTSSDSVTVTWSAAPPTVSAPSVSVSASDTSPTVGESVTVSWNITGEDITYSDFIGISSGAFGALSGSSTFRRTTPGSHTYTATATNAGGTSSDSVTVTWSAAPPTVSAPSVSVSASDTSPTVGESVTVSWSITGQNTTSRFYWYLIRSLWCFIR